MHALHGIRNVKACILDALRWEAESHSSNAREESPGGPFRFCSFPVSIAVAGGGIPRQHTFSYACFSSMRRQRVLRTTPAMISGVKGF